MSLLKSFLLAVAVIIVLLSFMLLLLTRPELLLIPVAMGLFGWLWHECHDFLDFTKESK